MNNEIETVGDLVAALQRFDAALPVRCLAGGGCSCEDYYYLKVKPKKRAHGMDGFEDRHKRNLREGYEFVEL